MKYLLLLNRAEDALPEPGTPAIGIACGNGWWPLHRSR